MCVCWCCCGVTGLSQRFCAALSYVKLHLHLHLCLALLSRGSAPPAPICPIVLIVDHNAVTPWPLPTTGKLIELLPSHTQLVIQPMKEQQGGFSRILARGSTQALLIPPYRWQPGATTHTSHRDMQQKILSEQNLEHTPTFSTLAAIVVIVAMGQPWWWQPIKGSSVWTMSRENEMRRGGLGHPQDNLHGHGEMWSVGLEDPTLLQRWYQNRCIKQQTRVPHQAWSPEPNFLLIRLWKLCKQPGTDRWPVC